MKYTDASTVLPAAEGSDEVVGEDGGVLVPEPLSEDTPLSDADAVPLDALGVAPVDDPPLPHATTAEESSSPTATAVNRKAERRVDNVAGMVSSSESRCPSRWGQRLKGTPDDARPARAEGGGLQDRTPYGSVGPAPVPP
jgi:hypothetical protein